MVLYRKGSVKLKTVERVGERSLILLARFSLGETRFYRMKIPSGHAVGLGAFESRRNQRYPNREDLRYFVDFIERDERRPVPTRPLPFECYDPSRGGESLDEPGTGARDSF
jgi:hypothetical protein